MPGELLGVAYNPADPNHSFHVGAPSKPVIGCLIPAIIFLALIMFLAIGWFTPA